MAKLRSRATLRVVDVISEGEIVGLVDGARSIYFDDTPLQNADDSFNFEPVQFEERFGLPDQAPLLGFPAVEQEVGVGVEILQDTPVVRTVTAPGATAVRVTIRLPSGLFDIAPNSGDINRNDVDLAIDVQPNGGMFTTLVQDRISGKTMSPYERSYRINLPGSSPWTVRVRRITGDSEPDDEQDDTWWSSYTIITDHRLSYPDSAIVAVAADAEALGEQIPTRSYEVKGLKIKVPSNYDPIARTYTGIWNGEFVVDWTDNPAWIFYDLLTNARYGLGEFIGAGEVDKWALFQIAQYCDGLVLDGRGGMEPRFTFNGGISDREEAFKVVTALAGVFRGMVYWGSGLVTAVADAPSDPVKLVTPANVVGGEFTYSGTALKARHTVALVQWQDPSDSYKEAVEVVEDPDGIDQFGWRETEVIAFGCTSRGQAHRFGKWALDSERHETETVTYTAGLDHADITPGDIINVADPAYAGVRYGGRIAGTVEDAGSVVGLVLDAAVTLAVGQTYAVTVVMPDGSLVERPLTNGPGPAASVTFDTPLAVAPVPGAMWIITGSDAAPRPFRVLAVRETEKHLFEITALFHDATKYDRVERDIVLESPSFSVLPTGPILAPTDLRLREYLYRAGDTTPRNAVTLSWEPPADPRLRRFEVESRAGPEEDWSPAGTTVDPTIDVLDIGSGPRSFRVRSLGVTEAPSAWLAIDTTIVGLLAPPGNVLGFAISVIGATATLSWLPVSTLNLSHYVVRFTPTLVGATWGGAPILLPHVAATSVQVPALVGTYLVKAVTLQGVESTSAALVISNVAGIALNAVEVVDDAPTWPGNKMRVFVVTGGLQLGGDDTMADWISLAAVTSLAFGTGGIAAEGTYEFANTLDLGQAYTSRLTATLDAIGVNLSNTMASWLTMAAVPSLSGADPAAWDVSLEVRTTRDDPSGAPVWSPWADLVVGDYTARGYQFRLILRGDGQNITPRVSQAQILVDMPDRVVGGDDLICPTPGLDIDFVPPFRALKGLAVSAQGLQTGDYYTLTAKDETGFTIRFFDAGNAAVQRTFDYVATGYGEVTA